MTANAIFFLSRKGLVGTPQNVHGQPSQFIAGKVFGPPIGPLGRYRVRVRLGRQKPYSGIYIRQIGPPPGEPLIQVVNVPADFGALGAQG